MLWQDTVGKSKAYTLRAMIDNILNQCGSRALSLDVLQLKWSYHCAHLI